MESRSDWTGIDIERARQELEQASATLLGRMLFEFSRLDVALGLLLAWSNEGSSLAELTKEVEDFSIHKKLDRLEELVKIKYEGDQVIHSRYSQWLSDARSIRRMRNEFVHGRWGIDHANSQIVNVVGLPTSPEQRQTGYSIAELTGILDQMKQLQTRLALLGEQWPI